MSGVIAVDLIGCGWLGREVDQVVKKGPSSLLQGVQSWEGEQASIRLLSSPIPAAQISTSSKEF